MQNALHDDNQAYRFPVSIKGVVFLDARVVLLQNERDEWELPGGKLELGEAPPVCVSREIEEELGLAVETGPLLDSWVYTIRDGVHVLIVTYGCPPQSGAKVTHSPEHKAVGQFPLAEIASLNMPQGYKDSIINWARRLELSE
jgi:8-oxo-dGTP pyrophosphatase MutT (NUDIX family)